MAREKFRVIFILIIFANNYKKKFFSLKKANLFFTRFYIKNERGKNANFQY